MSQDFEMKTGDLKPHISATLGGGPTSWAGATAKIVISDSGGTSAEYTSGVTLDTDAKTVEYNWTGFDTTSAGLYSYEWVVVFGDGDEMTCPGDEVLYFRINTAIGE